MGQEPQAEAETLQRHHLDAPALKLQHTPSPLAKCPPPRGVQQTTLHPNFSQQ